MKNVHSLLADRGAIPEMLSGVPPVRMYCVLAPAGPML